MSTTITRSARRGGPCTTRIRLADGRVFSGALPTERHRRIHLGLLHADSDGYVEIAAGRRPPGGEAADHHPQGPRPLSGRRRERGRAMARRAARARRTPHRARRRGLRRRGGAPRRGAGKAHVSHTQLAVDRRRRARRLAGRQRAAAMQAGAARRRVRRLRRRALLLAAARTRYTATRSRRRTSGSSTRWATTSRDGRPVPTVADVACKDRSRVMRLAGTVNGKSGRCARIVAADFAHPGWVLDELLAGLPATPRPTPRSGPAGRVCTTTRTRQSRRPSTSGGWPGSRCRPAGSCTARARRTPTRRRAAMSAATPAKGSAVTAAASAARSTTSRPPWRAARPGRGCAARRFVARASACA